MEKIKHNLVFIVEDNDLYSLMLDYTLSNQEIVKCKSFRTGEECIANLDMNPMLVVLDYGLPGMNGKETFEKIKELKPGIPVVILTGSKDMHLAQALLKEGVYDYLLKEKDSVEELRAIIDKVLDTTIEKETEEAKMIPAKVIFGVFIVVSLVICAICLLQYLR